MNVADTAPSRGMLSDAPAFTSADAEHIAREHFASKGVQAEVIYVQGSVELAPLVGLGDGIVDLVATGRTLEENELEVREEIVGCTARFVANRVAHKLRAAEIDELAARLREATGR